MIIQLWVQRLVGPQQLVAAQGSNLITIKKMDSTNHSIIVQTDKSTTALKKNNEQLRTQWTQPFFLNGQWQTIHP